MTALRTLMSGIAFGESPRWHEGRLWFCDWGAEELIAVDLEGNSEVIAHVASFPFCIDWLRRAAAGRLGTRPGAAEMEPDGSLRTYADLSSLSDRPPGNEIVVDGRGHAYVNGGGFDLGQGRSSRPGSSRCSRRRLAPPGRRRHRLPQRDGSHAG